jgi:DNA mismatch repair ATPase MutL
LDFRSLSLVEASAASTHYSDLFQIEGYISSCAHSSGRGAPDRQYVYINKRPCDHSRITKLINEIFHQYNRTQYPMFVLNLKMKSEHVDVNVTPDKLQMFIRHEAELLAVLKASLLSMYGEAFKTLNLNSSTLVNENLTQKIVSFFSKKPQESPAGSQAATSTQLESQRIAKRFRKRPESDESTESNESSDESSTGVAVAGKERSPKAKVAKISAYFDNESIIGKEVVQTRAKTNIISDKENRSAAVPRKGGLLLWSNFYYIFIIYYLYYDAQILKKNKPKFFVYFDL